MNKLLESNFDAYCLNAVEVGWKHGRCQYNEELRYIFMVKNPYSWVISFQKWEMLHDRTKADTLDKFLLENVTHPQLREEWGVNNPVSAWNETLRSWGEYRDRKNVVFVRYEDLLESFDEEMSRIRDRLGLKQNWSCFKKFESRADNWETPQPRNQLSQGYYRDGKFMEIYNSAELASMRKLLDKSAMDLCRYEII